MLNNLAMATADVGNWTESQKLYEQSLSIKQAAGDLYGQALTMLNMARNYQAQDQRTGGMEGIARVQPACLPARIRRETKRLRMVSWPGWHL